MLQDYLNANLLTIKSDEDFKKLKKSADDIARKLTKSKTKIVSYTLIVIDPEIDVDNADITEVKDNIIKNWRTFAVNAKDTPLTYIRAVILEALSYVSKDINHSLLIWFASRNIVQYQKLIGKEKAIILEFIAKQGSSINQKANQKWALSTNNNLPKADLALKEISKYLINDGTLVKYLEDAVGPQNKTGSPNYDSPNPNWPSSPQNWSYEFPPRATKGIKAAVDNSLKAIVTITNENINTIQNSINKAMEQVQNDDLNNSNPISLRSELLWWKEAKYSHATDKGYNELNINILEIVLALDYSTFIPVIYPKSVDYFLKETYTEIKGESTEELTFEDFLKTIQEHSDELKPIFPEEEVLVGKATLLSFITSLIWNKNKLAQFEEFVGIPLSIKLSSKELTTWLFHDFQLVKIINTK